MEKEGTGNWREGVAESVGAGGRMRLVDNIDVNELAREQFGRIT